MDNNEIKAPKFRFTDYIISETSVGIKSKAISDDFRLSIQPTGELVKDKNLLKITLNVAIKDANENIEIRFTIIGSFEYEAESLEELVPYIIVNGPAILFPYLRAFVSNITALSGCNPVIMPTYNMIGVGEKLLENMKAKLDL